MGKRTSASAETSDQKRHAGNSRGGGGGGGESKRATLDALTEVTAKLTLSNAAESRILAGAIFTTVLTPVEAMVVEGLLETGVGYNQQAQEWAKAKKEALSKG